jgi:hypothetical protein
MEGKMKWSDFPGTVDDMRSGEGPLRSDRDDVPKKSWKWDIGSCSEEALQNLLFKAR